jgi:predicted RNA-binding protein with PIN domain
VRWLVDGYNVIRRDPDLRGAEEAGLEPARRALLRLVIEASRRSGDPFTVIFDGAPAQPSATPGTAPRVEVLFSRPPESADDVLIRLAARLREAAVVVTSDRTVQHAAERAGAVVVGSSAFVAAVRATGSPEDTGTDEEDDDEPAPKRGNPRRRSREARAAARVLGRLGRPPSGGL